MDPADLTTLAVNYFDQRRFLPKHPPESERLRPGNSRFQFATIQPVHGINEQSASRLQNPSELSQGVFRVSDIAQGYSAAYHGVEDRIPEWQPRCVRRREGESAAWSAHS
jgi:hypothetical protein